MTALARFHSSTAPTKGRVRVRTRHLLKSIRVDERSLDEAIEDAQLNAIADERADGPFVRVSLDDL